MPFINEDKALTKNLYKLRKYSLRRILVEFSKINSKKDTRY